MSSNNLPLATRQNSAPNSQRLNDSMLTAIRLCVKLLPLDCSRACKISLNIVASMKTVLWSGWGQNHAAGGKVCNYSGQGKRRLYNPEISMVRTGICATGV